jgi:hypothetical protein
MADLNVIYKIAADISGLQSGVDRAAKSTEGLEKMAGRVGKALTAAFSIAAVEKLAKDVVDFAGTMVDLSAQTGLSTDTLQKFDLAFSQAGVSIESVANASIKLANNLVGGDKSTVGAIQQLGLSVATLKRLAPEDQFLQVADAIGKIQNPTERAYAALQIFGKGGAELLKGFTGTLQETIKQFEQLGLIITEKDLQALDAFGDQWPVIQKAIMVFTAQVLVPLLPGLLKLAELFASLTTGAITFARAVEDEVIKAFLQMGVGFNRLLLVIAEASQKIPLLGKHLGASAETVAALREQVHVSEDTLRIFSQTTATTTTQVKAAVPPLIGLKKATEDAEKAARKFKETLAEVVTVGKPVVDVINSIDGAVVEGIRFYLARGVAIDKLATIYGLLDAQVKAVADQMKFEQSVVDATTDVFKRQLAQLVPLTARYGEFHEALTGVDDATGNLHVTLIETNDTLITFADQTAYVAKKSEELRAALKRYRAEQQDTDKRAREFRETIGTLGDSFVRLAQVSDGTMSNIARAIGTVIVAMDQAAKSGVAFEKTLTNLDKLDFKTRFGQGVTALASFAGALIQATSSASTLQNVAGGALTGLTFGAPYGPYAAVAGLAGGAAFGFFRSLVNEAKKAAEAIKAIHAANVEFIAGYGGLQQLAEDAATAGTNLNAMMTAKTPEEWQKAINDLTRALDFQNGAMQTLDETVKKYGFSLAELGPTLQRQQLDKRAQELYQDFKVLTSAGIGVDVVLGKMSESINTFVQDAIATGTEVPIAMKPMLEQMIAHGELLDENGEAYESLEETGLTFAETMTQGFNRLIETVDRLTKAIARGLGVALDDLPDEKTVKVGFDIKPPEDLRGPVITYPEYTPLPPSAILTPGDMTAASSTRPVVMQETVTLNLSVQAIDSRDMAEAVEKEILPRIVTEIEDRRRGYAGRLARALQDVA